jgi:hypothetical protein
MLDKIIKYKKEAELSGKNSDSLDDFILWIEKKRLKIELEKEQIKKDTEKDLDKLIDMEDQVFANLLDIDLRTAETILVLIEAYKNEFINAAVYDDFVFVVDETKDSDEEE